MLGDLTASPSARSSRKLDPVVSAVIDSSVGGSGGGGNSSSRQPSSSPSKDYEVLLTNMDFSKCSNTNTNMSAIQHIFNMIQQVNSNNMYVYNTLPKPEHFQYLSYRHTTLVHMNDHHEFLKLLKCLESIQIDTDIQIQLFSLLMGILYLGNVKFEENDDNNQVPGILDSSILDFSVTSKFLGVPENDLLFALTKQNMYVGGNVIVKVASQHQAYDKRDSLCKTIYAMIFSWLVDTINLTIAAPSTTTNTSIKTTATKTTTTSNLFPSQSSPSSSPVWGFIGILDIYGFENFTVNGFEQLLINYANEKLQNHFNKHIFQIEQNEYVSESIDWTFIQYNDNQTCIDLIDNKINGKTGIFQTLDDINISNSNQGTTKSSLDVNSNFLAQINAIWAYSSITNSRGDLMSPVQVSSAGNSNNEKHLNYLTPRFNSGKFRYFRIVHDFIILMVYSYTAVLNIT